MCRKVFFTVCFVLSFFSLTIQASSGPEVCATRSPGNNTQYVNTTLTLKILLVEFPDVSHRTNPSPYTSTDFENLLVNGGVYVSPHMYSPDGDAVYGSLRDYYAKMSNGNLSITGHVINDKLGNIPTWIQMTHNKSYYYNQTGTTFLDDAVDRAQTLGLDVSTSATVKLVIIYAGNTYLLQPSGDYSSLNPMQSGYVYIMSERQGKPYNQENSTDKFSRIGYHCHEFGHIVGISHSTASRADVMEAGYRNGPDNDGAAPAPINPIARMVKGWLPDLTVISGRSQTDAYYSLTSPQVFRINSNTSGYYFLIENRRFDQNMVIGSTSCPDYNNSAFIPISWSQNSPNVIFQHGILVWRVKSGGPNDYNDNGLIYASGIYGASYPDGIPSETDAGDFFQVQKE